MPNNLPSLFLRPCFVVGIPEALAIFCFAFVTPVARLMLKDSPGIALFFFAIYFSSFFLSICLLRAFIYPAVIMPDGRAIIAIPITEETMVMTLPAVDTG